MTEATGTIEKRAVCDLHEHPEQPDLIGGEVPSGGQETVM